MGTGKTVVGGRLAKELKKEFFEMDEMIVRKAGKSIPAIFSQDGEIRFREYEMQVCKEVSQRKNAVIACGGGVILNKLNIDYLKLSSVVICLKADPKVIFKRTMADGKETRPLLNKPEPMHEIETLLAFRRPFYNAATDHQVDTTNLTIDEVVEKLVQIYTSAQA
jgi:shikimate kinase